MKKAKALLTTLTVLAVVGGALAFKAQKAQNFGIHTFYYPTQDGANCTIKVLLASSFTPAAGVSLQNVDYTTNAGGCLC